jgi:diaminopimelate decarboxylase
MLEPVSGRGTPLGAECAADTVPRHVREHLLAAAGEGVVGGYAYDPHVAAARARELRAALPPWATLLFALKANGFPPVVRALAAEDGVDGLEVASASEARLARALLPPGGLVAAAGPAKHPGLLADLLAHGVDVVHAESALELRRLARAAEEAGTTVAVALRVNPAHVAVAGTLAMGGRSSAFGFPEPDVPAAVALAQSLPALDLVGFHVHAVCGNRDARAHAAYVAWCLDWASGTAAEHGIDLRWIDVGGGFGVSYDDESPLDLAVLASELDRLRPPAGARVVLEPGRWLAADCGWYAAEVVDVKESYGETFVVVRGGIDAFALPGTEDFPFPLVVLPVDEPREPGPRAEAADVEVTVAGELCTPEDVLVRHVRVERVRSGDLVVLPKAGAYGWEFALPAFLGHPRATREVVASAADPSAASTPTVPHALTLEATP